MDYEVGLINGKVFYKGALQERNIYISDGKIERIRNSELKAEKVFDCKGRIIIPGMIDAHVHLREPGMTQKEDFLSGSMAAAHGGVTTIIDMPNTKPPTLSVKDLEEKRKLAKKSIVNYGFHFGAAEDNLDEIKKAWKKNIASVKIFMNISTGRMLIENEGALGKIFSNSKIVTVHAEGGKAKKAMEIRCGKKTKLYLCHISTREELDAIKKEPSRPFVEVTPHHLFLTSNDVENSFREMLPSLKSKDDQAALWSSIKGGIVTSIGSDHAPHTKAEKKKEDAPKGVPGLETTLPLMLDAVNKSRVSLSKVVELCCENPAKTFGIKSKGFIEKGYDADIAVANLNKNWVVKGDELFTKCGWSPFEGFRLKGGIEYTFVNGKLVYDGSNVIKDEKGKEAYFHGQ